MTEVKLFTQSYREAKESGLVGKLEGLHVITGSYESLLGENPYSDHIITMVNANIEENASKLHGDYVFGIDYKVEVIEKKQYTFGSGDAYRLAKPHYSGSSFG